jgi:hypothetical protein
MSCSRSSRRIKWLDRMGSKEAAWGRAYQEASKQLLDKYAKAGGAV